MSVMSADVMPETSENSAAVHGTPFWSQPFPTAAMTLTNGFELILQGNTTLAVKQTYPGMSSLYW